MWFTTKYKSERGMMGIVETFCIDCNMVLRHLYVQVLGGVKLQCVVCNNLRDL